jgi:ankyrin repeat protein
MTNAKTDREGRTELHYAAIEGQLDRVRSLLADGSDANASDKAGWTPLHFAAQRLALDVAKLLVQHGADVNA